jgi:hypothetical protein
MKFPETRRCWNVSDEKHEPFCQQGAVMAYAGKKDAAIHMVRLAIEQNFCAYSALESDPLLDKLRATPEFRELLKAARFCQQPLLAHIPQGK